MTQPNLAPNPPKEKQSWWCSILSSLLLLIYLALALDRWEDKLFLLISKASLYVAISVAFDRYSNNIERSAWGRFKRFLILVVWLFIGLAIFGDPKALDYHGEPQY